MRYRGGIRYHKSGLMDDPLDIQLYPQPWITYSLVFHMIKDRDAQGYVAWSIKSAQNQILHGLGDWIMGGSEFIDYESFQADHFYGQEVSESDYMILDAILAGQQNPLSIPETGELIERLDNIVGDYAARYAPQPTPGPWARAERDQLFNWLVSRIRRYAQVDPLSARESIDWSQGPQYAVERQVQGQSEMTAAEIASRLSAEGDLEVRIGEPQRAFDVPERAFDVLHVRLSRELPDGSPEALSVMVSIDKETHKWGRPPVL